MKRIIYALLMGLLLGVCTPVPAHAETYYHAKTPQHSGGRMTINLPSPRSSVDVPGAAEMVVWYNVVYRDGAKDLIWVRAWKGNFWPDRNNIDCANYPHERAVQGVWFKPKLWQPATGRNYNPTQKFAKCHEDAYWTTGKVYLTKPARWFYRDSGKVLFRAVTVGAVNDWTDTWDSTTPTVLPR